MRAAAARTCRNPSKHIVISTISRCDVKKTYENTPLSHPNILKICPRAHAESFQNQWFFNIPIKRGFEGNFCAHLELLQQRLRACEGHHPLQKMTRGPHARGRRARAPRNPAKHTVISTISSYGFNKTYERSASRAFRHLRVKRPGLRSYTKLAPRKCYHNKSVCHHVIEQND